MKSLLKSLRKNRKFLRKAFVEQCRKVISGKKTYSLGGWNQLTFEFMIGKDIKYRRLRG